MIDQQARERRALALKAAEAVRARDALTPLHAAAEAGTGEAAEAEQDRERIRHADPYPPDAPEVAHADLGKFRTTEAVSVPTGYPQPAQVSVEDFRRGPITADHYNYGPGYDHLGPGAYPVPVPTATISAMGINRPLLTDGQAAASAGG